MIISLLNNHEILHIHEIFHIQDGFTIHDSLLTYHSSINQDSLLTTVSLLLAEFFLTFHPIRDVYFQRTFARDETVRASISFKATKKHKSQQ